VEFIESLCEEVVEASDGRVSAHHAEGEGKLMEIDGYI